MPRVARIVIPGCPHHITQRGNNRQDVFFVDDDRRVYLELLSAQSARYGLDIHAYALMTNHVHLVATPRRKDSLARAVGRAHYFYTLYVNRLHGRAGHLWQNRFFSTALDDAHLWTALTYVERNPVRAGLVRRAWRYEWSSAAAHCGKSSPPVWLEEKLFRRLLAGRNWREALTQPQDDKTLDLMRRHTLTGRPLGSDSFLSKIETAIGRRLRPLTPGRKKGWRKGK
jgi:putative transposase